MRYFKALLLIAFFFVSMLFFVQNTADLSRTIVIRLQIMNWNINTPELPIYLLVLSSFAVGAIVACLYFLADKIRCTSALREEKARVLSLQSELAQLRTPAFIRPSGAVSSEQADQQTQS